MAFVQRTKAPSTTDKNFIKTTKGGKNKAMLINKKTGSVLPNCCGYVHGRWLELFSQFGIKGYPKLCKGNAKSYYGFKDGYKRGKTPKLGAISCYKGGKGGGGHVAIVEKIYADGSILMSESQYGGKRWGTYRTDKKCKYYSGYTHQGFIYLPEVVQVELPKPVSRDLAKKQVEVLVTNLNVRTGPGTSNTVLIKGKYISKGIYNILNEFTDTGKMLWLEVEPGKWIGTNTAWTKILITTIVSNPLEEENKRLKELLKQINELSNIK